MSTSPMIHTTTNAIQRRQLMLHHARTRSVDSYINPTPTPTPTTPPRRKTNVRLGELCGGTTADVAAVCCCCPCGLASLVVLAVYKAPAGIYRRALRHRRMRRLHKEGLIKPKSHSVDFSGDDVYFQLELAEETHDQETEKAVLELENEMFQKFYNTGFWRSPSYNEGETPRFQVQPL